MLSILETLWPETFWAETFWAGFQKWHYNSMQKDVARPYYAFPNISPLSLLKSSNLYPIYRPPSLRRKPPMAFSNVTCVLFNTITPKKKSLWLGRAAGCQYCSSQEAKLVNKLSQSLLDAAPVIYSSSKGAKWDHFKVRHPPSLLMQGQIGSGLKIVPLPLWVSPVAAAKYNSIVTRGTVNGISQLVAAIL